MELGWHIPRNFFKLVTLFQRIFKSGTSRHKCGDIFPPPLLKICCKFLVILNENPLCIGRWGFLKAEISQSITKKKH
jgi:hypothetical protein